MHPKLVTGVVTASALLLVIAGALLLVAPGETAHALFPGAEPRPDPLRALFGASLFGFGMMNWIARRSLLGGIYGRAVVVGNQTHFLIGALVLLRSLEAGALAWPGWLLFGIYLTGAAFFAMLLFRPPAAE